MSESIRIRLLDFDELIVNALFHYHWLLFEPSLGIDEESDNIELEDSEEILPMSHYQALNYFAPASVWPSTPTVSFGVAC